MVAAAATETHRASAAPLSWLSSSCNAHTPCCRSAVSDGDREQRAPRHTRCSGSSGSDDDREYSSMESAAADDTSHELEYADEDDDEEDDKELDVEDEDLKAACGTQRVDGRSGRRLWDKRLIFPSGVSNWRDTANCAAALNFVCLCNKPCLARVGDVIKLYEHRKSLRVEMGKQKSGGMRDVLRQKLAAHYDSSSNTFQNSFVVGGVSGLCDRAFAVAAGVSEATFVRARADVTLVRPTHAGRLKVHARAVGADRAALDAWVRAQRNSMEGDKITGKKWYTEKTTEKQLWDRYVKSCDRVQQPTKGSSRLLFAIWKQHSEIVEVKPTGHAICDTCSDIHTERLALEGLHDAYSKQRMVELGKEADAHNNFHSKERAHYDDAVHVATHHPEKKTCITIDAPTQHQFDLPSQARWKRDTSKKLDGTHRWQSKVEGVLDAGVGMMVFIARTALGGGGNLTATVLMLSLMHHVKLGRELGDSLHLQLDNTTAENKNNTLLGCVGLLIAWGVFQEATIFFMPVGHTFNELDAAFSPLIQSLMRRVIPTVQGLISFLEEALAGKRVRVVQELHHLWNFDSWAAEHMHPIGGYARTQQSSGMHELHIMRDSAGDVRVHMRQSSQSSTWLPEGDGDLLFKSIPSERNAPPIAHVVKAATVWNKAEVHVNVRRWLPHLGLTPAQLSGAEQAWEQTFKDAVETRMAFLKEAIKRQLVMLVHIDTAGNVADIGTKPLGAAVFHRLREFLVWA